MPVAVMAAGPAQGTAAQPARRGDAGLTGWGCEAPLRRGLRRPERPAHGDRGAEAEPRHGG